MPARIVERVAGTPWSLRMAATAFAVIAIAALAIPAYACDIAAPWEIRRDTSERIAGWNVYKFQPEAPAAGHVLFRKLARNTLPARRGLGRFIEQNIRPATSALYQRRVTAAKVEFLKEKTYQSGNNSAEGYVFVAIFAFGPDSVRASGYLRHNAQAGDLSLMFAVTHPDEVRAALPVVERFASHPGHECQASAAPVSSR